MRARSSRNMTLLIIIETESFIDKSIIELIGTGDSDQSRVVLSMISSDVLVRRVCYSRETIERKLENGQLPWLEASAVVPHCRVTLSLTSFDPSASTSAHIPILSP
jgi:hypothetical protein